MEIVLEYVNPVIIAITLAIVQFVKPYVKIDTRLVSLVVATVLVLLANFVVLPETVLLTIENIVTVVLPAFGFDYAVRPIYLGVIKPILDLLAGKK